jgi:hypothetical protein
VQDVQHLVLNHLNGRREIGSHVVRFRIQANHHAHGCGLYNEIFLVEIEQNSPELVHSTMELTLAWTQAGRQH